jgi:cytochrome P450
LVIAALFGVPEEERREFAESSGTMMNTELPFEEVMDARARLMELVAMKRERPSEDIFSWLINDQTDQLNDEELKTIGLMLITAGHETRPGAMALGSFALTEHPDQLALRKERPELMDSAMDELLRCLPVGTFGIGRVAKEDVEIGGRLIKKDQTVVASVSSADRDADQFENPDVLDCLRRGDKGGHADCGRTNTRVTGRRSADRAAVDRRPAAAALLTGVPTKTEYPGSCSEKPFTAHPAATAEPFESRHSP